MKLGQRIFILICLVFNSFSNCSLVVSPNGYYNIYRENNFGNILNLKPTENQSQDSYYPDVCRNADKNKDGETSFLITSFSTSSINYLNVIVTKGSHMVLGDFEYSKMVNVRTLLNIVCVGVLYMSALVILPGGSFECLDCSIRFRQLYPTSSKIDPFGFFPGVLALGGSLSLIGKQKTTYTAINIGENILEVQDLSTLDGFNGHSLSIFSESFPLGQSSTFSHYLNRINVLDLVIPKTDKNIRVFFDPKFSFFSTQTESDTASIHITGNTNVYIENFYINSFGKTTNDQYNDTELVFSPDDPNLITEFINGNNQRFRNSLYIELSNNVTITNSVILETKETRLPLVFFGNIISSKSGSSLIAQYGTENIQSTNNYYSLSLPLLKPLNSTLDSMDYGNEGNGIFSISPKIYSANDTFNGQIIAINHIILSVRSSITGFDKDCYSSCYNDSIRVSSKIQHSTEFKITGSTFISSSNYSESSFLFRISETGSKQSSFYKIINSNLSYLISVLLENNAFILDNVYGLGDFSINGYRWAMIDSNIEKEIVIDGNIFKKGCQQQVLSNCTISTNSKLITGLPNVTESDQLNRLFSSGITSISPYEPVTITIPIDKESKKNQIQLFFTHQPIDIESSLLSIYVENQPIFLLEPLQSNLSSTFKNLTFHYENSKSLEIINISFTTRGDTYLTSMAVYSSAIPIVITPTSIPKTSKTTSKNKLKIALPIFLFALLVAVGVLC
ncbi:hypothetical protein ACTFIY_000761 [Dictyostelium cf. discoideum]